MVFTRHHYSHRLSPKSPYHQEKQIKQSTHIGQLSSKLHTDTVDWVEAIRGRRPRTGWGGGSMQCLSTSLLIKEPLFTSGSVYDKERSQVHIFSPRRAFFCSSSKPSPHRHSPHRNTVPEAKVLTGVAQWEGNQTSPFLTAWQADRGAPLTYKSPNLYHAAAFQEEKRGSFYCPSVIFSDSGFCLQPVGCESLVSS